LFPGCDIRTIQELLGHSDVGTTIAHEHVLSVEAMVFGVRWTSHDGKTPAWPGGCTGAIRRHRAGLYPVRWVSPAVYQAKRAKPVCFKLRFVSKMHAAGKGAIRDAPPPAT